MQHLFLEPIRPIGLLKSEKREIPAHQDGPLHQHPIGGEKRKLLVLAHGGQLVFQPQGFILQAAGIEQLPQWQTAEGMPAPQLVPGGVCSLMLLSSKEMSWLSSQALAFLQVVHLGYSTNSIVFSSHGV